MLLDRVLPDIFGEKVRPQAVFRRASSSRMEELMSLSSMILPFRYSLASERSACVMSASTLSACATAATAREAESPS